MREAHAVLHEVGNGNHGLDHLVHQQELLGVLQVSFGQIHVGAGVNGATLWRTGGHEGHVWLDESQPPWDGNYVNKPLLLVQTYCQEKRGLNDWKSMWGFALLATLKLSSQYTAADGKRANECLTEPVLISFIRLFLICIYIAADFYWYPNTNASYCFCSHLKNQPIL